VSPGTPDLATPSNGARPATETKLTKDATSTSKVEVTKLSTEPQAATAEPMPTGTKKENTVKAPEDRESKKDTAAPTTVTTTTVPTTTKSGRASKPSTPALATFAEAGGGRRPARNADNAVGAVKRSHKKGASISASAAAIVLAAAQQAAPEKETRQIKQDNDDEGEVDGDEPRYCYCNNVSYGEMVACDADSCPREWFHLECVGLKIAPKGNSEFPSNVLLYIIS
jgi:hypothetical protein